MLTLAESSLEYVKLETQRLGHENQILQPLPYPGTPIVGANTPNIPEDLQDSAPADKAPKTPKQVPKEQITEYQVSKAPN